jgi:hypothetical protein
MPSPNTPAGPMKFFRSSSSIVGLPHNYGRAVLHSPFRGLLGVHSHYGLHARNIVRMVSSRILKKQFGESNKAMTT